MTKYAKFIVDDPAFSRWGGNDWYDLDIDFGEACKPSFEKETGVLEFCVGRFGSGKTTYLKRQTYFAAKGFLQSKEKCYPLALYIDLSSYKEDLESFLSKYLLSSGIDSKNLFGKFGNLQEIWEIWGQAVNIDK